MLLLLLTLLLPLVVFALLLLAVKPLLVLVLPVLVLETRLVVLQRRTRERACDDGLVVMVVRYPGVWPCIPGANGNGRSSAVADSLCANTRST